MTRKKSVEVELEDEEENEIHDDECQLLKDCLEYLQDEAVENGWGSESDGWEILNRIRVSLDMNKVKVVDEPDYTHFKKAQ